MTTPSIRSYDWAAWHGSSVTISRPWGIQPGDLLLCIHSADQGTVGELSVSGGSGGWSTLTSVPGFADAWAGTRVSRRVATASEPPSGALTVLAGGAVVVAQVVKLIKRLADAIDDWQGEPDRPGVSGRPGVMERLAVIEAELHPNHGASLRDVVDRLEHGVRRIEDQLAAHLEQHRQEGI